MKNVIFFGLLIFLPMQLKAAIAGEQKIYVIQYPRSEIENVCFINTNEIKSNSLNDLINSKIKEGWQPWLIGDWGDCIFFFKEKK